MKKKVVIIGLDSATSYFVKKFAEEGYLPNIKKLMDNGVWGEAVCPFPSLTGSNWHTIATGAWPKTHGCTDMWIHVEGEPLDKLRCAFYTTYCRAEYLWNVAERFGKKPLLMKYSASLPFTIENGIQVEGCATPWWGGGGANYFEIAPCQVYTTLDLPDAIKIKCEKAEGWTNVPGSRLDPLESEIFVKPMRGEGGIKYSLLIFSSGGDGYDTMLLCDGKDGTRVISKLKQGLWSNWLKAEFAAIQGPPAYAIQKIGTGRQRRLIPYYEGGALNRVTGTFRFKLIELSKDGDIVKLYRSQIYPTSGFTKPDWLSEELVKAIGPFQEHIGPYALYQGWIDEETFLEELEYQASWLGRASKYIMKKYDWDIFFLQWHGCNHAQHAFWSYIDPISPWYRPNLEKKGWTAFRRFYGAADKMVGDIVDGAGENAVIMIVSDHGHIPLVYGTVYIANILIKEGLLYVEKDSKGEFQIVWSKTKAVPVQNIHIFVNLKGREPHGIVEPGEEYERVRDQIIHALLSLRDPVTGKPPVALALRREDSQLIGLGGDRTGDVIYAMTPGYHADTSTITEDLNPFGEKGGVMITDDFGVAKAPTSIHGQALGTAKLGLGTIMTPFIVCGPGIKKGYVMKKPVELVDIAPTAAYILQLPPPANSEGRVIHEIFE